MVTSAMGTVQKYLKVFLFSVGKRGGVESPENGKLKVKPEET